MTLDDYEDLVGGLERGTVPAWFAAESAGSLGPLLTRRQLVRLPPPTRRTTGSTPGGGTRSAWPPWPNCWPGATS